jgi:hypothetical protein
MHAFRTKRKHLGVFLLIGVPIVVSFFVMAVTQNAPWWSYCFMFATMAFPLALLVYQFITDAPVLLIEDGYITIPRLMFRPIRIPLRHVRHARIVRVSNCEGEGNLFEVALTILPPELAHLHNTFATRATIKDCKRYGGYQPPEEPFLILQTQMLDISFPEFNDLIEAERLRAFGSAVDRTDSEAASSHA